jgi:phage tail sheath protein FI
VPALPLPLVTGVPAFLGLATAGARQAPEPLQAWSRFGELFGGSPVGGFLAAAVEGFFVNGGTTCYVIRLDDGEDVAPTKALERGLAAMADIGDIDLVCLPDASRLRAHGEAETIDPDRAIALQRAIIDDCELDGTRVAILDTLPGDGSPQVLQQRLPLTSAHATLYHPWILARTEGSAGTSYVPPCGHVAGIYSAVDRRVGVHKAPANEVVNGALDLQRPISNLDQAALNPVGVNCLRAFPGRGIRVWGARTLATDPAWRYVNVRRLLLTAGRWIERNLADVPFEPNEPSLWARVHRDLEAYFAELHRKGALKGASPQEAFYVRCDASTNAGREQGQVVAEVGLAAALPAEFIVVHFIHEASGISVAGPI